MEWNFCRLSAPTYLLSVSGSSQVSFSCALGKLLLLRTDNGHPKNVLSGIFCTKWKIFLTQKWMYVPVLLSGGEGGFFKHTSKTKYRNPTRLEPTMHNPQSPEVHLNPIFGLLTSQSTLTPFLGFWLPNHHSKRRWGLQRSSSCYRNQDKLHLDWLLSCEQRGQSGQSLSWFL